MGSQRVPKHKNQLLENVELRDNLWSRLYIVNAEFNFVNAKWWQMILILCKIIKYSLNKSVYSFFCFSFKSFLYEPSVYKLTPFISTVAKAISVSFSVLYSEEFVATSIFLAWSTISCINCVGSELAPLALLNDRNNKKRRSRCYFCFRCFKKYVSWRC